MTATSRSAYAVAARVGADTAAQLRELTLAIYRRAAEIAAAQGIIIADTWITYARTSLRRPLRYSVR